MSQFVCEAGIFNMTALKMNSITVEEYLEIRRVVGWKTLSHEQAELALANSLYIVGAYEDERLVGMGRVVGDGAVICYVQDLIVVPDCQQRGVGSLVLEDLIHYVEGLRLPDTELMLCLMCAKGREPFYTRHGFVARPTNELGPGMIQYLKTV